MTGRPYPSAPSFFILFGVIPDYFFNRIFADIAVNGMTAEHGAIEHGTVKPFGHVTGSFERADGILKFLRTFFHEFCAFTPFQLIEFLLVPGSR